MTQILETKVYLEFNFSRRFINLNTCHKEIDWNYI